MFARLRISPLTLSLLAGVISIMAVVIAVGLQLTVAEMKPCPLCILQRYALVLFGLAMLSAAISKKKIFYWLGTTTIGVGLAISLYHNWVLANPTISCGIDPLETFVNTIPLAQWWPTVFMADGLCSAATPPFLGLSIVHWAGVLFLILSILSLALLRSVQRSAD